MKYIYGIFNGNKWTTVTRIVDARRLQCENGGTIRRMPYRAWMEAGTWDAPTFIVMSDLYL